MGGTSGGTQAVVQQSKSEPWSETQPILNDALGALGYYEDNGITRVSQGQQDALAKIQASAGQIPDYTGQATGVVGGLLSGGPDRTGIVNNAYSQYGQDLGQAGSGYQNAYNTYGKDVGSAVNGYQNAYNTYGNQLSPYMDPSYLDPTKVPGINAALGVVRDDAYNKIAGSWAGAGRDPSGSAGAGKAIGRGIAAAEAPLLLGQYNTNADRQLGAISNYFGAGGNLANYKGAQAGNLFNAGGALANFGATNAGSLFGAGNKTAGNLASLDQAAVANKLSGLGIIPSLSGMNAGANAQLQAENYSKSLPLQNYADLINMILPIAGLGGQTTTQGTQNSNYTMSGAQQFGTIASGIGALLPKAPMSFNF